jgi:hypothetical protein
MHTTTVRFPIDTWAQLQHACERAGIPAGQYIREATIARLAAGTYAAELTALRREIERINAQIGSLTRVR